MNVEKMGVGVRDFDRVPVAIAAFNAVKSRGVEYLDDYDALFWKQFWGLSDLAKKHGITRQRASMVFKCLYPGISMNDVSKLKSEIRKKEIRNNCQLDPISKVEYHKGSTDCPLTTGINGESIIFKKMLDMGLDARSSDTATIDAIVNGHNVEIKTATKSFCPGNGSKKRYYRFNVSGRQTNVADFFVFFINSDEKRFFVVPSCFTSGKMVYIPEGKFSRYSQFEDAWHLLKTY